MDKKSLPRAQSSTRSGRGGPPNAARSVSQPSAPANATPGPSTTAAQNPIGQVPGWYPQQPSPPSNGPGNIEEVARALRTIQDAYPFLVQSVAHHQQGHPTQFPSAVPPQLLSQPPWPLTQPSTSYGPGVPASPYTPGFGQLVPPDHYPADAPYLGPQSSTPLPTAPGQSSFQTVMSAQAQESAPLDAEASAEEKRRRNTAASARFRVKKKMHTHSLERNVTDLSGRVDELEQEAADLRRENGWLKEIVMLKSGRARGGDLLTGLSPAPNYQGPQEDGDDEDSEERGVIKGQSKKSGA